jgi:2-polyprenyl-6-methoxyphenol hydroxylase-like FAD-dependent oxidoreductase
MDSTDEVLIVGAGPTGLLLAGDLAAAGVACTVLERRADESNLTRVRRPRAHPGAAGRPRHRRRPGRHRHGGRDAAAVRQVQLDLSRLPSRFPFVLITPQYHTERLLIERAALGAEIAHGAEVVGLR